MATGQVVSRADVPPGGHTANGIRDAAKRAIAGARGPVARIGVAMPAAGEAVPPEITAALRDASSRETDVVTVAAGTAAAMAEQWCGAARGLKQVVTFAIAEHVTAGVLINGEPWRGAHGLASSVAWLAMNPVEREDYRRYGGLEAEIATAGIVRRFVWRIKSGDQSAVADRVRGDFTKIIADDIFQGEPRRRRRVDLDRARYREVHRHGGGQPGDDARSGNRGARRRDCELGRPDAGTPSTSNAPGGCNRNRPSCCASCCRRSAPTPSRSAPPGLPRAPAHDRSRRRDPRLARARHRCRLDRGQRRPHRSHSRSRHYETGRRHVSRSGGSRDRSRFHRRARPRRCRAWMCSTTSRRWRGSRPSCRSTA